MLDCLRLQSQLLNRLNSPPKDSNLANAYFQSFGDIKASMPSSDSPKETLVFTPENSGNVDFDMNAAIDTWKPQTRSPSIVHPAAAASHLDFPAHSDISNSDQNVSERHSSTTSPKEVSLDERLEWIMERIKSAGFDNFDALVTAYYSETFRELSPLANEQRLSRNRRLPGVMAELFNATSQWTDWERRGFQEEILKTAETMLISEGSKARNTIEANIGPLRDAQDKTKSAESQAISGMKSLVQNELPNLWALAMALTTNNKALWQRDRSNTALATIVLLHCAGRIPNDQLLGMLTSCL